MATTTRINATAGAPLRLTVRPCRLIDTRGRGSDDSCAAAFCAGGGFTVCCAAATVFTTKPLQRMTPMRSSERMPSALLGANAVKYRGGGQNHIPSHSRRSQPFVSSCSELLARLTTLLHSRPLIFRGRIW